MTDITLLELLPEYNPFSQKWEVRETDERDNEIAVHSFDSSKEADAFVDEWIDSHDNPSNPATQQPSNPATQQHDTQTKTHQ